MKRFFDIVLSGLALVFFLPLFLLVIVTLRFTGEGEIFFLQKRLGINGRVFRLFKFATMLKNSPNCGNRTVTMKDDPRILPVGKFLRKTKINELPQLINIFIGDMSIVGPRPLTEEAFDSYPDTVQSVVRQVRPGLSGIGSIIFRNEEDIMQGKSATLDFYIKVIAPYKGSLEVWFVANQSLRLYFLVIIVTIIVVFSKKTGLPWKIFSDLPKPPDQLKSSLNFES